jgi:5-hydroxyisourate hydrolase
MARLTTHILDTASGRPAAGVTVELLSIGESGEAFISKTVTNDDGRGDGPLADALPDGVYELRFHVGDYFRAGGQRNAEPLFLDVVPIRFGVTGTENHYHVPLLISPFGYSTYRGS